MDFRYILFLYSRISFQVVITIQHYIHSYAGRTAAVATTAATAAGSSCPASHAFSASAATQPTAVTATAGRHSRCQFYCLDI